MKTLAIALLAVIASALAAVPTAAQSFSFEEMIGTWEGTVSSEYFGGYTDPITLMVHADGTYDETSGHLSVSYYDQRFVSHEASTNRVKFRWLTTVYSGQYFYTTVYFEVVEYTGDHLVLHYNFDDLDQPLPEVQSLVLTRAGTTSVGDQRGRTPAAVISATAYPNPFNPATRLAFSLPSDGPVRVEVLDLRGRRVALLHQGPLAAGRHELEWRGRDAAGQAVPGGVYLASIQTPTNRQTVKLTLAK